MDQQRPPRRPKANCGLLAMLLGTLCSACAVTVDNSDLPTAVRAGADEAVALGSQLFYFDRMTALAEAIYHAELSRSRVPEASTLDWAISPLEDGGYVVAFIIDVEEDGFVDGEVFFAVGADPDRCLRGGSDPADYADNCDGISVARVVRPASPGELAWAAARRTMFADPQLQLCTDDAPRFTLIEEGQRTLGYVLSASADPDLAVLSGHTRYLLSSDGKQIQARTPLFQDCLVVRNQNTASTTAMIMNTVGWDLFNEGHVYMTLERRLRVIVAGELGFRVALDKQGETVSWRRVR